MAELAGLAGQSQPVRRATQSLIGTIQYCLHSPTIVAYEIAWRWAFGLPTLWLVFHYVFRLLAMIPPDTINRLQAEAYDPVKASAILVVLFESLLPTALQIARWLVPLLLVGWAIVSGVGRWLVLRRVQHLRGDLLAFAPGPSRVFSLIAFQALRIVGLSLTILVGFLCIRGAAGVAFADLQNPNLVFYFAVVIVSVLGLFTIWALSSWIVNIAPLLLVREKLGFVRAMLASVSIGRTLTSKLMEINLVLGIVKLALLVLGMVFSAVPLPFESVTTPHQLHVWWAIVSVAYLMVNAFFQVVRLVAALESLAFYRPASTPAA